MPTPLQWFPTQSSFPHLTVNLLLSNRLLLTKSHVFVRYPSGPGTTISGYFQGPPPGGNYRSRTRTSNLTGPRLVPSIVHTVLVTFLPFTTILALPRLLFCVCLNTLTQGVSAVPVSSNVQSIWPALSSTYSLHSTTWRG